MKNVIIGLGNTGDEFIGTRHNIGMDIIIKIKNDFKGSNWVEEKKYKYSSIKIRDNMINLVITKKYVNTTGKDMEDILNDKDIDKLIVIQDEINIENGTCKLSFGRGDAGHNGIKDIFNILKSKNCFRIRVGIGKSNGYLKDFVLEKFSAIEQKNINELYESKILPTIKCFFLETIENAQKVCNTKS